MCPENVAPRRGGGHVADRASRGHSAPRAGVRAAVYALTLAALFAAPTPALAQDQLGGGWTKVRHMPSGNTGHPALDLLVGTDTYGDSSDDSVAWSIDFESAAPGYNQFLFSSGDGSLWLVATKSAVVGEYYSDGLRDVMASSLNADAHQVKWYRRSNYPHADPLISLRDHHSSDRVKMYVAGGNSLQNNGAWDVYVRAACDAFTPPVNGDFGTCTGYLVYGQSCVPTCNPGFVLEGVTLCTDGVMTEAVCLPDVTTRAELKAAVDSCVGDQLCELTMPLWDVSQVTDMSFLFQNMTGFDVDISRWNVSQVTDARGMFQGATNFYRNIIGWTFPNNANTTGMFTGADTWFSRASRDDTLYTTDGPPGAWVLNMCLDQERVELGVCAPCTHGGTNAAGDNPALGIDTGCAFPDSAALKTAVDNCIAVDPTGVACCSQGANCGAAGTAEMAVWDVSLVTSMSNLFKSKASFNADISRWYVSSVTSMNQMFQSASNFNADISRWDVSSVTSMYNMFAYASSFNRSLRRWNTNAVDNEQWGAGTYYGRVDLYTFVAATAWYARYATCGYKTDAVCSDVVDFSNDLSFIFHYSYNGDKYVLAAFVRKDNACDASTPPYFGGVGNCTDTLLSGTSCVPTCDPGYVLNGVTSCTDRVLTEAVCDWPFTDRAELKATVDACLDAVPSGERCCSRDPQCWHPELAKRRCGGAGCVDMPDWDVSQVTDAHELFAGRSSFFRTSEAGPSPTTLTRPRCSRAPTRGCLTFRAEMGLKRLMGHRANGRVSRAWRMNALSLDGASRVL